MKNKIRIQNDGNLSIYYLICNHSIRTISFKN
ncbi:hypothetical protein GDI3738 [Gluconacetobacter diazotrophicus PA1 5]|uniref:Uncharacterized protein n=1 Tax=Gluconacetobacter diazotrophicus (strain ATCC 49037 / DSM 5601 / CCUG 37298 / CIP 103539 / LMG 7603 / PAl5) TaxID=272568 RepID=A9H7T4_GLUDA|nr:hypothetical protein GDI3738 [Gluconacetobacter diazotrophicus PA1 5]